MGCVHVYTGDGKGKTSAAVGLGVRALGHGLRVCFIQLLKPPDDPSGEIEPLRKLGAEVFRFQGQRPTFTLRSEKERAELVASSALAFARIRQVVSSHRHDVVIVDELCPAIAEGLIPEEAALDLLKMRPPDMEFVITGRDAPASLTEAADLVTRMECVRHPYDSGDTDRPGIDR